MMIYEWALIKIPTKALRMAICMEYTNPTALNTRTMAYILWTYVHKYHNY